MAADLYRTSDLYLAAYLSAVGCERKALDREGQRIFFGFSITPDLRKAVDSWTWAQANVEAVEYSNSIREYKRLVHHTLASDY